MQRCQDARHWSMQRCQDACHPCLYWARLGAGWAPHHRGGCAFHTVFPTAGTAGSPMHAACAAACGLQGARVCSQLPSEHRAPAQWLNSPCTYRQCTAAGQVCIQTAQQCDNAHLTLQEELRSEIRGAGMQLQLCHGLPVLMRSKGPARAPSPAHEVPQLQACQSCWRPLCHLVNDRKGLQLGAWPRCCCCCCCCCC
jgi:hypothetical protein